ncbi:MAG TPA: LysM peptidoglycan-binding domain-containing protein [Lacipirellulaceae bacterium]|nr:LysM peptidoglycan-binding domain-containing protein [Lacipirellulaceae bacterium]
MRKHYHHARTMIVAMCVIVFGCARKSIRKGSIPPGDYVVLEGDDLSNIALRAYGDMNLWQSLLNANRQIAKRPRFRLELGETLHIPEKEKLDRSLPKSIFPKQLPADYIVMPGDSLPFIAKGCYGDRDRWLKIYAANRNVLSEQVKKNPRLLIAGQVLHIPANDGKSGARAMPSGRVAE